MVPYGGLRPESCCGATGACDGYGVVSGLHGLCTFGQLSSGDKPFITHQPHSGSSRLLVPICIPSVRDEPLGSWCSVGLAGKERITKEKNEAVQRLRTNRDDLSVQSIGRCPRRTAHLAVVDAAMNNVVSDPSTGSKQTPRQLPHTRAIPKPEPYQTRSVVAIPQSFVLGTSTCRAAGNHRRLSSWRVVVIVPSGLGFRWTPSAKRSAVNPGSASCIFRASGGGACARALDGNADLTYSAERAKSGLPIRQMAEPTRVFGWPCSI